MSLSLQIEKEKLSNKINLFRGGAQKLFFEELQNGLLIKTYIKFKEEIKKQVKLGNIPAHHNLDRIEDSINDKQCSMCNHVLTNPEIKKLKK